MLIFPAILTDKKEKLEEMLKITKIFSPNVHIDIMDGNFVPSYSISYSEIEATELFTEIHLMVNFPCSYIEGFKAKKAKRIMFHIEAKEDPEKTIKKIKEGKMQVGISLNPETPLEKITPFLDKVDMVLIMSVQPGFYGSKFIKETLNKAIRLKKERPKLCLEMDGGIKKENILLLKPYIDIAAVGSEIFLKENPKLAYEELLKII